MAGGAHDEFWRMWLTERAYFQRMCARWLGDRHDVDDVLSRAALVGHDHVCDGRAEVRQFRPWMLRVLQNMCLDVQRGRTRAAADAAASRTNPLAPSTPEREVFRGEIAGSITRAAATLPPRLYEPFMLRFIEDMSYEDISHSLGISPQNARKRIQQAREQLRAQLVGLRPGGP